MTPSGSRKHAAGVEIPVKAVNAEDPPVKSMAVTKMFVKRPKVTKTKCVVMP